MVVPNHISIFTYDLVVLIGIEVLCNFCGERLKLLDPGLKKTSTIGSACNGVNAASIPVIA